VAQALLETNPLQQRVFRTAWRHYRAFLKTQGYTAAELPDEQDAAKTDEWLEPLRAALHRLLPVVPMTPAELRGLTYGPEDGKNSRPGHIDRSCTRVDGVVFYATARPFAKKQPPL
jgi:hypothetical protein